MSELPMRRMTKVQNQETISHDRRWLFQFRFAFGCLWTHQRSGLEGFVEVGTKGRGGAYFCDRIETWRGFILFIH